MTSLSHGTVVGRGRRDHASDYLVDVEGEVSRVFCTIKNPISYDHLVWFVKILALSCISELAQDAT